LPSQKPVVPQVAAPCAAHWLAGSAAPTVTGAQVPALPVSAHDMHVDPQAVAQQTPCAQIPVLHSVPPAQAAPVDFRPHDPPVHTAGGAQSAVEVHVALQAAAPQVKGAHDVAAGLTQVPAPSQVAPAVEVVPPVGQVAAPHDVPWAYFWQDPAAHLPLVPQLAAPWSLQPPAGSGIPGATSVQRPSDPVSAHERHDPVQAVAQQIPCAQVAERHSALVEQEAPLGLRPHELAAQTFPIEHSALVAQEVKHLEPLQVYGAHVIASGAAQLPLASQLAAGV
jgi:hypothetical protein